MSVEIPKAKELEHEVFAINNEKDFTRIALQVYHFQFHTNQVYQAYCKAVGRTPEIVLDVFSIPFLPIAFFKSHRITSGAFNPELVFKSSGTTGHQTSTHFVKDAKLYQQSFMKTFELFYGPVGSLCVLGLLPSYLSQGQSSLVYMVDQLIRSSGHSLSGFYLDEVEKLHQTLLLLESRQQKTLLIGVTYALLDFADRFPQRLEHTIVMETGGMKGRRREIIKNEMYDQLRLSFHLKDIHSEYGMTELLSQAYAINGSFKTPPWMKILIRDETDPFLIYTDKKGMSGGVNIIDLANLYSCSFIATDDVARIETSGLELLGRMDESDIRGCSLLSI